MARPTGARDRLKNNFVAALADDFKEHGVAAIVRMREEDPSAYIKVIASLMPKELDLRASNPLENLTDEQLDALHALLESSIVTGGSEGGKEVEGGQEESRKLH